MKKTTIQNYSSKKDDFKKRWNVTKFRNHLYSLKTKLIPDKDHPKVDDIDKYDFRKISLIKETINKVNFSNSDLSYADLSKGMFKESNFSNCILREAKFYKSRLDVSDFTGSKISKTSFRHTDLANSKFCNAVIDNATDFAYSNLKGCNFDKCSIEGADFRFVNNLETINGTPDIIKGMRIFHKAYKEIKEMDFGKNFNAAENSIEYEYDLVISFAGADRPFVDKIAEKLKINKVNIYYAPFSEAELIGKNLLDYFQDIYFYKGKYALMVISKDYMQRVWPNYERQVIQSRDLVNMHEEYTIPLRLDDTEITGLLITIGYLDARKKTIDEIVTILCKKILGCRGPKP